MPYFREFYIQKRKKDNSFIVLLFHVCCLVLEPANPLQNSLQTISGVITHFSDLQICNLTGNQQWYCWHLLLTHLNRNNSMKANCLHHSDLRGSRKRSLNSVMLSPIIENEDLHASTVTLDLGLKDFEGITLHYTALKLWNTPWVDDANKDNSVINSHPEAKCLLCTPEVDGDDRRRLHPW